MSRMAMNIPNTMVRNASNRFGSMRSDAAGTLAAPGNVVASAMAASPLRLVGDDRRRRGLALGTRLGVDGNDDGHARPQHLLGAHLRGHTNAHGNALHDFGEVAGRV